MYKSIFHHPFSTHISVVVFPFISGILRLQIFKLEKKSQMSSECVDLCFTFRLSSSLLPTMLRFGICAVVVRAAFEFLTPVSWKVIVAFPLPLQLSSLHATVTARPS
jgi:hypothetical protein